MYKPFDIEAVLDSLGVRNEYTDGQYGRYVFNIDPDVEWHTNYRRAKEAGIRARELSDEWAGGITISLIDSNDRLLRFKETIGKDDIVSALRLFRGDVAAAAEYLKGRQ